MATIRTDSFEGNTLFLIRCDEPLQKAIPSDPPYDSIMLYAAMSICPDTQLWHASSEHILGPADFGDEQHWFAVGGTNENVEALLSTDFEWTREAKEASEAFETQEDRVEEMRANIAARLEKDRKSIIENYGLPVGERESALDGNLFWHPFGIDIGESLPEEMSEFMRAWIQRQTEKDEQDKLLVHKESDILVVENCDLPRIDREIAANRLLRIHDLEPEIAEKARAVHSGQSAGPGIRILIAGALGMVLGATGAYRMAREDPFSMVESNIAIALVGGLVLAALFSFVVLVVELGLDK